MTPSDAQLDMAILDSTKLALNGWAYAVRAEQGYCQVTGAPGLLSLDVYHFSASGALSTTSSLFLEFQTLLQGSKTTQSF